MIKHIILIFFLFVLSSKAQTSDIEFQRYSTSDGLSTNWGITSMVQDSNGYLWIATAEGLNRFDGYEFKIYRYDPEDSNSLRTNNLRSVLLDSKNRLWIGAFGPPNGGIGLWNAEDDNFLNPRPNSDSTDLDMGYIQPYTITSLFESKSGNLWVGSMQGCDQFNTETLKYVHYSKKHPEFGRLSRESVSIIIEDSRDNLWVGTTNNGLFKYGLSTGELELFSKDTLADEGLIDNYISSLYEDDSGVLFIGTNKSGLHVYDYDNNKIVRVSNSSHSLRRLEAPPSDGFIFGQDGGVRMLRTKSGNFWLSTTNGGIKFYNEDFSKSHLFRNDPLNNLSLSDNFISEMFEDNQNNIWFGTSSRGLMKVTPSKSLFRPEGNNLNQFNKLRKKHIRAIYEDKKGRLWIGTIDGLLFMYDPIKLTVEEFQYDKDNTKSKIGIIGPDIDTIYEDEYGIIWIGTFNGPQKYDPINKTGKFQLSTSSPGYDQGVIIPNFTDGYLGDAPDIGAHENGWPFCQIEPQRGKH